MDNKKLVTVKVTSLEGHTEFSLTAKEAIGKINEIYTNENKWLYIDGTNVTPSRLTESMLEEAHSITLANVVVGGNCCGGKPELSAILDLHIADFVTPDGDTNVTGMSEKSVFPITFEYVPSDPDNLITEPRIRVWVDPKYIVEVSHLRNFFFKGGLEKLEEFLMAEVEKFHKTYNI